MEGIHDSRAFVILAVAMRLQLWASKTVSNLPIPNLFIGAIPPRENLPLPRRLIAHWSDKRIDMPAMNAFLEAELCQ